ncbi:Beta-scruin [Folsomia candida]|uniref:Beta-scruin n=1 Tax=Folsomia candida TaxID=158441 RepID=A0A226F0K4_FOLCA|nr:Beta-scruin [Folsomia candida]
MVAFCVLQVAYENRHIGILLADPTTTRLQHQEFYQDEPERSTRRCRHFHSHAPANLVPISLHHRKRKESRHRCQRKESRQHGQRKAKSGEYILVDEHENEIKAAITIQRYVKGFLTRRHILKMNLAAKVIQNALRAHWANRRNDYRPVKDPIETDPPLNSDPVNSPIIPMTTTTTTPRMLADLKVPRDGLMVFGGTDPTQLLSSSPSSNTGMEIFMYLVKSWTWKNVGSLPEPRTHFGIARVGYEVYIIGGTDPRYKTSNERNIAVKSVWKVNLKTGEWYFDSQYPSDLDHPRSHFGCAAKDGTIYVFGGNDTEARGLSTCSKYDTTFDAWEPISPMDGPRVSMAVSVYEDRIWVAGGVSKNPSQPVLKSVLCYDTGTNSWTASTSLPLPRAFSTLVVAHGKLFILGGAGPRNKKSKSQVSLPDVLVLDKTLERWRDVGVLNTPRHGHAAVAIDHQIIVLGGVSSEHMGAINSVEIFDLSTSHSQKGRSLYQNLSGMGAVSIQ